MIKGYCHTNLDDYKLEKWPTSFCALPRVGDFVKSEDGKILKVVDVIHFVVTSKMFIPSGEYPSIGTPMILVELHKG